MKKERKVKNVGRMLLIAACVMALLTVSAFAANEATGGAVFEKISIWVNGVAVDVEGTTGSYTPNGDGSYTIELEDGQKHVFTVTDASEGELVSEDGETYSYYSTTFEFDDEDVHEIEVQMDGITSESAPVAEVNP